MPTTLFSLPYSRFVRQAHTEPDALVSTEATLRRSVDMLKATPWRQVRGGLVTTMPPSDPAQSVSSDAYDAYKFSGDCAPASGKQASFVGMAAYRFRIPATALDGETAAQITAASIRAYANKFNAGGLLVTSYLSDSMLPSDDWTFLSTGTFASGQVLQDANAGTKAATNKSAIVPVVTAATACRPYLWVIVQLFDWPGIKWEYWIEGAGMLDASTLSVTFDRDGVTADADDADTSVCEVVVDGNVFAPSVDAGAVTREVAQVEFAIGKSSTGSNPSAASAASACGLLLANVMRAGIPAVNFSGVDMSDRSAQSGLACAVSRSVAGASAPFVQILSLTASVFCASCSIPADFVPTSLWLENREGCGSVAVSGLDVRLSVYWIASKMLNLSDLAALFSVSGLWTGAGPVAAGDIAATLIGSYPMPDLLAEGSSISIPIKGLSGRYGTIVIVPWVNRMTVGSLAVGQRLGFGTLDVSVGKISGAGWLPDLTLEK